MSITVVTARDENGAPSTQEVYAAANRYKITDSNLEILTPDPKLIATYGSGNWMSVHVDNEVEVITKKPDEDEDSSGDDDFSFGGDDDDSSDDSSDSSDDFSFDSDDSDTDSDSDSTDSDDTDTDSDDTDSDDTDSDDTDESSDDE
ncbi:MAG TPA: hypothetical protein VGH01_07765 [Jatrophihabitantaceae bacterium]|jgi:hypothetical protein